MKEKWTHLDSLLAFLTGISTSGLLSYFLVKKPSALEKAKAKKINSESMIEMWRSLYETQSQILEKQTVAIEQLQGEVLNLKTEVRVLASENLQLRIDLEERQKRSFCELSKCAYLRPNEEAEE